ncbi:unnamed protein product [Microthlaspi erraticum]|uniref:F-box domain-containing protein n=1 Tax=Microthlaspi erraticum TaxID=1685480 RepID=A0A6D2HIM6_9BRAS|nr:unnamed protein product [Microthlaspi erraticum]
MGDLPEDLLLDILSKVPRASLAKFRLASKGWKDLIKKDGRLVMKSLVIMLIKSRVYVARFDPHGSHKNVIKVSSQIRLKDPFSKEVNIHNVFHCDGLLLCTTEDKRLVVLNPVSGKTSWVKPRISHENICIYALGRSSCNKYKILRINKFLYMDGGQVDYEIYDFNTKSWRVTVGENRDWFLLGLWPLCGMSVNGNTYWLADDIGGLCQCIISFDFAAERFGRVSLPYNRLSYDAFGLSVTREEQQLCLLTRSRSREVLDLWRATKIESSGATSWGKFLSVDLADLSHPLDLQVGMNFVADRENKVLVRPGKPGKHKNSHRFFVRLRKHKNSHRFLHIVGEDIHIKVDGDDGGSKCSVLVSYVPTLVQIQ